MDFDLDHLYFQLHCNDRLLTPSLKSFGFHFGNNFNNVRNWRSFCRKKTKPKKRFLQVLTLWTCFPCIFDMSTMLKLCWNYVWPFGAASYEHFLKLLPIVFFCVTDCDCIFGFAKIDWPAVFMAAAETEDNPGRISRAANPAALSHQGHHRHGFNKFSCFGYCCSGGTIQLGPYRTWTAKSRRGVRAVLIFDVHANFLFSQSLPLPGEYLGKNVTLGDTSNTQKMTKNRPI